MVCQEYMKLRELYRQANRKCSRAVRAMRSNHDAAMRQRIAEIERDEALHLLARHKGTCLVCANIGQGQAAKSLGRQDRG